MAVVAVAMAVGAAPSYALELRQSARIGAGSGRYSGELRTRSFDPSGNPTSDESGVNGVRLSYGGEAGYTLMPGDFYCDVGLNFLRDDFADKLGWRTDLLLTAGYYLTNNWSLFAGFRRGWQGSTVFRDSRFRESGPYAGMGYGFALGGGWLLNGSFAYNFDRVEGLFRDMPGTDRDADFSYPGISLKLGVNRKGAPHTLQLRLQRFARGGSVRAIDDVSGDAIGRVDFSVTETSAVLSYVYTLAW